MKIERSTLSKELTMRAQQVWSKLCGIHPKLRAHKTPTILLNNRMWRCAGQAYLTEQYITLSAKFYDAGYSNEMNEIILPHELVHMADYYLFGESDKKCGHGSNWCMLMLQYGIPADKYHSLNITQQGVKK